MEYKKYKIEEIGTVVGGGTPSTKNPNYYGGNIPWITPKDLANYSKRYIQHGERNITDEGLKHSSAKLVPANAVLMTSRAPIGYLAIAANEVSTNQGFKSIVCNEKLVSPKFLYYLLQYEMKNIKSLGTGSTFSEISGKVVKNIEVNLPNIENQKKIETILDTIDEKIETNQHMIANLEELSQTLFKRWFVDFEFPDEDGNPYKSSGGEMVDSELGEIPKIWSIKLVIEIAESFNSIRKPLSKLEREKRESIYPYYGATKIIDYVDNYIFDGKYILVGEDGTVQTETGNPFIQYVWGKFWVSNHAHILKGKLISDELLMLYLKNTNVVPYITGAVQPKLNKKNLNSIKFVIADKETIIKFENFIKSYFQKIRILNKETKKLIELRDTLLPKLMSGELEIPDDVEVNTDELSI